MTTVEFRASCAAEVCSTAEVRSLWADQPRPPKIVANRYSIGEDDPSRRWPSRIDADQVQAKRVRKAGYLLDLGLDPERCRFTYSRVTLVGRFEIPPRRLGSNAPEATDAIGPIITCLRWTLKTLYGMRQFEDGEPPLRGLRISVQEVAA